MYLTAFLTEELARIARLDRDAAARHARLVRLAETHADDSTPVSLLGRISVALRPTPAPVNCTPSC